MFRQVGNLTSGASYRWCLLARARTGDLVPAVGGCVSATPLGQPRNLRLLDVWPTGFSLQWDPPLSGAMPYSYVLRAACEGRPPATRTAPHLVAGPQNVSLFDFDPTAVCLFQVFDPLSAVCLLSFPGI